MEALVTAVIAAATGLMSVTLFGVFVVRPMLDAWGAIRGLQEEMLPLLREIVAHVRTDSGSSLLDIVNWLDVAAKAQIEASEITAANLEVARQLAEEDRATLHRIEGTADSIEDEQQEIQAELEEAQDRADEAVRRGDEAGAAADIATTSPPVAEELARAGEQQSRERDESTD